VDVQTKGFEKGKGFKLEIKTKDQKGNFQEISAFFKPMMEEFTIDKIANVKQEKSPLESGK
jgi:hypothetical protein